MKLKRLIAAAILGCLLVTPARPGEGPDFTPRSLTDNSDLTVIAPEEPIVVGRDAYIAIEGTSLAEVLTAQENSGFDLTVYPLRGVTIHGNSNWLTKGSLELQFRAETEGFYFVKLGLVREGKLVTAAVELQVGDCEPTPAPDPDPDPIPIPDPEPPKPTYWQVMFFVESTNNDDLTRDEQALVNGLVFRKELELRGHHFAGCYDHNSVMTSRTVCDVLKGGCRQVVEVKPDLQPWWDKKGSPMPRMLIAPVGDVTRPEDIQDFPLPPSIEAAWKVLEEASQ